MTTVLNTSKLLETFIACDDFIKKLFQYQLDHDCQTEKNTGMMSELEMMSIVIFYHHSGFKYFKLIQVDLTCSFAKKLHI
jgi:hypothetical protein